MWSPLQHTKEIFEELERTGFKEQVNLNGLERAIMKVTNAYGSKTIKNTIQAFEKLGYIKQITNMIWKIYYPKTKFDVDVTEKLKEETTYLDELIK